MLKIGRINYCRIPLKKFASKRFFKGVTNGTTCPDYNRFYFENWTLQFTYEGTQYRRKIAYFKMSLTTEANHFSRLASVVRG